MARLARWGALGAIAASAIVWSVQGCGGDDASEFDGGGGDGGGGDATDDTTIGDEGISFQDGNLGVDSKACVNLECKQNVACDGGAPTTSLSGTVYDPAGKVPLYNVVVYVNNAPVDPITHGATCEKCGSVLSGYPIATAITDAAGHFTLTNVPVGVEIPLVIQVGKWRRQIKVPAVTACTNTNLPATQTRLPRNQSEGDIPKIALATGGADPLECLLRKMGVDDVEFTTENGTGRVNLYAGYGVSNDRLQTDGGGAKDAGASSYVDGGQFTPAHSLWSDANKLKAYDMLLLACEGDFDRNTETKSDSLQALYEYANAGGRVFASHYHDYWFAKGPNPFPTTAGWLYNACNNVDPNNCSSLSNPDAGSGCLCLATTALVPNNAEIDAVIDQGFPKGAALADWMVNVDASTTKGIVHIKESKTTVNDVNDASAQRWIYKPDFPTGFNSIQYMTFNTPIGVDAGAQCGRAVYTGLHVSSGDQVGQPFPSGCTTTDLSPQEKALEFMLFDLSSCVQDDKEPPKPPPVK